MENVKTIDTFLKDFQSLKIPRLGYIKIPKYAPTEEECKTLKVAPNIESDKFLIKLVRDGFKDKLTKGLIDKTKEKIYKDRINLEFEVYKKYFFIDYVLLIYSIVAFCKKNDILNSPARGSCAGSLILYAIGVTSIDPIKYDLLFERFISSSRTEIKQIEGETYISSESLPDVDLDSDTIYKPLINKFLEEKFPKRTCRIVNLLTLQSKKAIKEMGKIVGMKSEEEMTNISSMIEALFGTNESLTETYDKNIDFKKWCDANLRVYEVGKKVEGLISAKGIHASEIFISDNILEETVPVELSATKEVATSYDMSICALLGIKVDNLGLKNLGSIHHCLKLIGKSISDMDVNDPAIYQYLNTSTQTHGIFQCEEGLGKNTILKIKPKDINEINLAIAMSRPGCYKFVDEYVKNKLNGTYDVHPKLKDILNSTLGIIVFQEQLMKISMVMGKFTPSESNEIRSAVGKKNKEKMASYKEKFIKQSIENGYEKDFCERTWQTFEDSGSYIFCAGHSTGYGALTAITTLLKAKYPLQYFLSMLMHAKHESNPTGEISEIHKEMSHFGIELLPPSLTHSKMDFTIEGKNIRFSLSSIKGIGEKVLEKLNNFKREHVNKFELFQAAKEAGLNLGCLSALIQAGCLAHFGSNRYFMVYECQLFSILTDKEKKAALALGQEFNYNLPAIVKVLLDKKDEKGKPIIKASRFETIKKRTIKYKAIYEQNKICQDFANNFYENLLCGYVFSKNLKQIYQEDGKIKNAQTIDKILEAKDGENVEFVGKLVENGKSKISKSASKSQYYEYYVTDETATIKVLIFNEALKSCKALHSDKMPKESDIIIIRGRKKGEDCVFANLIAKQLNSVFVKLMDVKDQPEEKLKSIL